MYNGRVVDDIGRHARWCSSLVDWSTQHIAGQCQKAREECHGAHGARARTKGTALVLDSWTMDSSGGDVKAYRPILIHPSLIVLAGQAPVVTA